MPESGPFLVGGELYETDANGELSKVRPATAAQSTHLEKKVVREMLDNAKAARVVLQTRLDRMLEIAATADTEIADLRKLLAGVGEKE
jgi:hypothetical protein